MVIHSFEDTRVNTARQRIPTVKSRIKCPAFPPGHAAHKSPSLLTSPATALAIMTASASICQHHCPVERWAEGSDLYQSRKTCACRCHTPRGDMPRLARAWETHRHRISGPLRVQRLRTFCLFWQCTTPPCGFSSAWSIPGSSPIAVSLFDVVLLEASAWPRIAHISSSAPGCELGMPRVVV
jgi:hypothetical protein